MRADPGACAAWNTALLVSCAPEFGISDTVNCNHLIPSPALYALLPREAIPRLAASHGFRNDLETSGTFGHIPSLGVAPEGVRPALRQACRLSL